MKAVRQITKHTYLVMDVKDIHRVLKEVCSGLLGGLCRAWPLACWSCACRERAARLRSCCGLSGQDRAAL